MAAAVNRAAILNTGWAEAPTENGEPGTAGTVFNANSFRDSARCSESEPGQSIRKPFNPWRGHETFRKLPRDYARGTANRMPYLGNRKFPQRTSRASEIFVWKPLNPWFGHETFRKLGTFERHLLCLETLRDATTAHDAFRKPPFLVGSVEPAKSGLNAEEECKQLPPIFVYINVCVV